jgi:hypothetical protein
MAPLGVTPGLHLVVCSDVRLIIIGNFPSLCAIRSQAQVVLYKTGPPNLSSVFLTELFLQHPQNVLVFGFAFVFKPACS